jgi:hypothetical protein
MPEQELTAEADESRAAVIAYLRVADFIDGELTGLDPGSEDYARLTTIAAAFRGQSPRLQLV